MKKQVDMPTYPILDPELTLIVGDHSLLRIGQNVRIDGFCKLEIGRGLTIGSDVHIASFCHIGLGGGEVIIEDGVGISSHAIIASGYNSLNRISMSAVHHEAEAIRCTTVLRKYSGVFMGGKVMPGVTLHEGAILAAGGLAVRDIPKWEIWAGTPARFFREREGIK